MILNKKLNVLQWQDKKLLSFTMEGDTIVILLKERDNKMEIVCRDFIGIKYLGYWKNKTVRSVVVNEMGDTLVESLFRIKKNKNIGNLIFTSKNSQKRWYELVIKLEDESTLHVACSEVNLIKHGN